MCGRYDNLIAREAYRRLFRPSRLPQSNHPPRYNIAPTDQIPIIRIDPRDGERELAMARWGLVPGWLKEIPKVPHINARCESVHEKPLFREAFAQRRALIPATGFFEWQKRADGKQPYRFTRVTGARRRAQPTASLDRSSASGLMCGLTVCPHRPFLRWTGATQSGGSVAGDVFLTSPRDRQLTRLAERFSAETAH